MSRLSDFVFNPYDDVVSEYDAYAAFNPEIDNEETETEGDSDGKSN